MTVETLDEKKLLPESFEALRNNRWVLQAQGIDSFLVKSVEGPELKRGANTSEVKLALYNVIGGNDSQGAIDWMDSGEERAVVIKHLDPVGTVVDKWEFEARPTKVSFSKLDYADGGLLITYVTLEVLNFRTGWNSP